MDPQHPPAPTSSQVLASGVGRKPNLPNLHQAAAVSKKEVPSHGYEFPWVFLPLHSAVWTSYWADHRVFANSFIQHLLFFSFAASQSHSVHVASAACETPGSLLKGNPDSPVSPPGREEKFGVQAEIQFALMCLQCPSHHGSGGIFVLCFGNVSLMPQLLFEVLHVWLYGGALQNSSF